MNRNLILITTLSSSLAIAACSDSQSSSDEQQVDNQLSNSEVANQPSNSDTINVMENFIAPLRIAPEVVDFRSANLFSNPGFEDGTEGWHGCEDGSFGTSTDAYEGDVAGELHSGQCFFRSIMAEPDQTFALSCNIKLTSLEAWTGMGLTFANANYETLEISPVAVATAGDYTKLSTTGTAPVGTSLVSMWVHSDHGALVDSCSLVDTSTLVQPMPVNVPIPVDVPMPIEFDTTELLENGDFSAVTDAGLATDWSSSCGGSVVADGTGLFLSDSACVGQSFSANEILFLGAQQYYYSCYIADAQGYSDMGVYLDDNLVSFSAISEEDVNTRVGFAIDRVDASNGFVSLFSDGLLNVQDCSVSSTPLENTIAQPTTPVEPTEPDTTGTIPTEPTTPAEPEATTPVESSATYRLTFNASWSATTHTTNFPSNAHFSGLAGAVHNNQANIWRPGLDATPGIQLMAETGDASILLEEVNAKLTAGTVSQEIAGGGVPASPGNVSIEFEVTQDHPLITVTAMVAPSPDWFVGVHDLALFDGTDFVDSLNIELAVYDSGTDSGVTFTSANLPSEPRQSIMRLSSEVTDSSFLNGLPSVGQFVIERIR